MTKSNVTKRALLVSALSVVMCLAMLIGTTFAWFTDTASTGLNKIQAGNLDVEFQYWDGQKYEDATNVSLFSENTLWEPGHTEVVYLKVINKGTLALKYRLRTVDTYEFKYAKNSKGDTILLSDYLEIGAVTDINAEKNKFADRGAAIEAAEKNLVSYDSYTQSNKLLAGDSDYIAFVVTMPTTVGNEANSVSATSKPWIRFYLALEATQVDSESDSFDDKYDENAAYPFTVPDNKGQLLTKELNAKENPYIIIGNNITYFYTWDVEYKTTIDLNGKTLSNSKNVFEVNAGAELTINGNGTLDTSKSTEKDVAVVKVKEGGKLTIENGNFIGKAGNSCIYNEGGTVEIKGGFFKCEGAYEGKYYVLNQYNNNPGTIIVTGGTFVNYDPSTGDDYLGGNFVADDYKVVSEEQPNGDIWYTVVAK